MFYEIKEHNLKNAQECMSFNNTCFIYFQDTYALGNMKVNFGNRRHIAKTLKILIIATALVIIALTALSCDSMFTSQYGGLAKRPCKIPKLDPWDKTIMDHVKQPDPLNCEKNGVPLFYVNESGYLCLNSTAKAQFYMTSSDCVYHVIDIGNDDSEVRLGPAVPLSPPLFVQSLVFRVVCKCSQGFNNTVYDFVHLNLAWNLTINRNIGKETDDDFSIIFYGIDSLSHSQAIRQLPNSYKFFKNELNGFDFTGYMKIAINSYPNLVSMMTGQHHSAFRAMETFYRFMDNMPFIWREKEMTSYATMFVEDRPDIAILNYLHRGFKQAPTDYYYRIASIAMREYPPITNMLKSKASDWWCYANNEHFKLQVDYFKSCIAKFKGLKKFSFFWNTQISHDSYNTITLADNTSTEFFQWLKDNGHLERSVLIFASDHGFRVGGPSETYVGRLENNMPLLMIHVPDLLLKKYPWIKDNMEFNSDKLVSAYDIYATMMDVITNSFTNLPGPSVSSQTSRSVFRRLPESRTCADAGIPDQFCTCHDATSVSINRPVIKELAKDLVSYINFLLTPRSNVCQQLSLYNITEAKVYFTASGDTDHNPIYRNPSFFQRLKGIDNDDSGRYVLMIYTLPNYALIEGMIDFRQRPVDRNSPNVTIVGEPLRINRYGNQSHCINERVLKQYCLCQDIKL